MGGQLCLNPPRNHLDTGNRYRHVIEGNIPASLGNLSNLKLLNLSKNKLEGDVPLAVHSMANLDFSIDADYSTSAAVLTGNALYTENPAVINASVYSQLTPQYQAHDANITTIAYLGGAQASLSWQAFDWLGNTPTTAPLNGSSDLEHGYTIYARVAGAQWTKVTTINDSAVTSWQGLVPGLPPSQSVEIQVRRTIGVSRGSQSTSMRELAESSGTQAPVTMINVTQLPNNKPSFTDVGDALNNAADSTITIPAWASNLNDGDSNTQSMTFELKYLSNASLFDGVPHISVPSGTLRFTTNANVAGESLVVFELCDRPSESHQAAACSEQSVFKIGVDNAAIAIPDFQINADISTDSSEPQMHADWGTGLDDGTGDSSHYFRFETVQNCSSRALG